MAVPAQLLASLTLSDPAKVTAVVLWAMGEDGVVEHHTLADLARACGAGSPKRIQVRLRELEASGWVRRTTERGCALRVELLGGEGLGRARQLPDEREEQWRPGRPENRKIQEPEGRVAGRGGSNEARNTRMA